MAGVVALAFIFMAFVDWTCPTTTMFMVTFSAPIFGFWLVFFRCKVKTASRQKKNRIKNRKKNKEISFLVSYILTEYYICTKIALCRNEASIRPFIQWRLLPIVWRELWRGGVTMAHKGDYLYQLGN